MLIGGLGEFVQAEVLFDVRVTDTNAVSYVDCLVSAVLADNQKYCQLLSYTFIPFVVSVDRTLALIFCSVISCLVVGTKAMVMCLHGLECAWPLLLFEQHPFAFMDCMCVNEVGPVMMMELSSLMLHWFNYFYCNDS